MDKKQLKNAEKMVNKAIKAIAKEYRYRVASYELYKKNGDFFLHTHHFLCMQEEKPQMVLWNYIKTYESDNLFWTIFDMESNIKERESLRAIGAFAMPSYRISEHVLDVSEPVNETELAREVLDIVSREENDFLNLVSHNAYAFNRKILEETGYLDEKLIKMIACIELGDIEKAGRMAEEEIKKRKSGGFGNNDKDIYQYIVEYCTAKCREHNAGWRNHAIRLLGKLRHVGTVSNKDI